MIRIDEIYNNVMWPWINRHRPGTRLFFCDPPGVSTPDALLNHGNDDIDEKDYVFCHDQEPVHLDLHRELFDVVADRALRGLSFQPQGNVIVSERGEFVDKLAAMYGWNVHYYFYHGWAALDWYRGYNRTFLIDPASERRPSRAFFSANRIVGGKRDHRVLFLYKLLQHNLTQGNWVSMPRHCPYEGVSITEIATKYLNIFPDIVDTFNQAELPMLFPGEDTQLMTSCWLSNFQECQDSLVYVPTETVYFGNRTHLTEKTFKPIALGMPFILVAPSGSLGYLREYGFQTFGDIWDESYDRETDDLLRLEKLVGVLETLNSMSVGQRQDLHRACLPIVQHNYQHFYGGAFENLLWQEFSNMLKNL